MINSKTLEHRVHGRLDEENKNHGTNLMLKKRQCGGNALLEHLESSTLSLHRVYTGCNERSLNQRGLDLRFGQDVACW